MQKNGRRASLTHLYFGDPAEHTARSMAFGFFSREEDFVRTTFLKWLVVVGGACLATAIIHPRLARSADHLDAPATKLDPTADINDVYAFLDDPAAAATNHVILAMTVYPAATATSKFSDKVQYVLHTQSGAGYGQTTTDFNVICTFTEAQVASCWAGADEYVTGDASQAAGITSKSGKLKVFAGLRADPFFFNLEGFRHAVQTVQAAAEAGVIAAVTDDSGCPHLDPGTYNALQLQLKTSPDGGAPVDFFKKLNGLAIVVQLDKGLAAKGGPVMSVYGSTRKKP
jgi:hypothetical protein